MEDIEANEGGDGTSPTLQTAGSSDGSGTIKEGNTALHSAVLSICREGNEDERFYRDIDFLMTRELERLNRPNKQGYTALGCAMQYNNKTCVEHMLQHESGSYLYLDYYPGDSQLTLREIITNRYPDLQPRLPKPIVQSVHSPDINMKLLAALQHDNYDIFLENLKFANNPNPWCGEPYYSSLLEIACQMKNRKQFVTLLLDTIVETNIKNSVTGIPLLHATVRSGNFEVLKMLLEREEVELLMTDFNDRTVLHWLAQVRGSNDGDPEILKQCFDEILSFSDISLELLNTIDSSGNTPFSISVKCELMDRILLFLEDDCYDYENDSIDSVLKSAEKSLLERILYSCLDYNDESIYSEKLNVKFEFWPLVRMVYFAADNPTHHQGLIKHPIMSIFVNVCWEKMKYLFFLNVIFYSLFLIFLTTYILYSEYYNTLNITSGIEDETKYNTSLAFRYVLMVLLGLLFVRELCQLFFDFTSYITSKENWLEILLIAVTFTSCSGLVESTVINRHFFAIAILLGWFELVLILGRLPVLSVQTEMLKEVSWTFLRFMAGYSILVIAFAFSFYILFKESLGEGDAAFFDNPFISVLRTSVMFAGEFDFSDLPFDTLPGTSHVIFLLFVFFVAIVLLNLLNGLAVGDTRKIREKAETLSLAARVTIIIDTIHVYHKLLKRILSFDISKEMSVFYPNTSNQFSTSDRESLQRIITEQRERSKKVESAENVKNWNLFAEKLAELQSQCNEMRQILIMIVTFLGIPDALNNVDET